MLRRFFGAITGYPRLTLAAIGLFAVLSAVPMVWIKFDNRPDSFLPPGHPALVAKETVEETFGLQDPILLALFTTWPDGTAMPDGIFRRDPLRRLQEITGEIRRALEELEGAKKIPPAGEHAVMSIATETWVDGSGDLPEEFPFLDPFPETPEDFRHLKAALFDLELYNGILVSEDGSAGAVVVLPPPGYAEPVYRQMEMIAERARKEIAEEAPSDVKPRQEIHLAGEAAVRSAMGFAVARDGYRYNPICFVVVALFLFLAFRNFTGVIIPIIVVGCSVFLMLGTMCLAGKPIYIITNAIAVTVMSIGVASSMHILAEFYEELGQRGPGTTKRELVVAACHKLWLPVLFTSVTDVAGFLSTFFSGIMPPLELFGLFSAIGLGAVVLYAWTAVPACLMLVNPAKKAHQRLRRWSAEGPMASGIRAVGLWCYDHPRAALLAGLAAFLLGGVGAFQIQANQSMSGAFREESPIIQADRAINRVFYGTYFLDILLKGEKPGDLLRLDVLRKIDELEKHAETLPFVGGTTSVAGFARKLNHILNHYDPAKNRLPESDATLRDQFHLIQEESPTKIADLRRMVDKEYRMANIRIYVKNGEFVHEAAVVKEMESYLQGHFDGLPVRPILAGRVNMDYHWMNLVVRSNVGNVALAMMLVLACMVAMFRSLWGGIFCLIPVAMAVLYTYGVMGFAGIYLNIGTTMFAAIATGVGVDYPTHILNRLRMRIGGQGMDPREAMAETLGIAGKAVVFNAAAVAFGFLVLLLSELPLLVRFGVMIAVGIVTACMASLTILPALVRWFQPNFVFLRRGSSSR